MSTKRCIYYTLIGKVMAAAGRGRGRARRVSGGLAAFFAPGGVDDFVVVEGERGKGVEGEPGEGAGIVSGLWMEAIACDGGPKDERYGVSARIASGASPETEWGEGDVVEGGLFLEFAGGTDRGVLGIIEESAGKRPVSLKGGVFALDEEDLPGAVVM
jgi:hypothetical protein